MDQHPPPHPLIDPPSPGRRVVRTIKQALVAVPVAWVAVTAPLEAAGSNVSPVATAAIVGVAAGAVVIISAVQNGWDDHRGNG